MTGAPSVAEQELESLTQFLYLVPMGLVQASMDGAVQLVNPMSAQLLLPLARDGDLTNLFDALERVAPDLRQQARAYPHPYGKVCDNLHLQVSAGVPGQRDAHILSLTLLKLDEARLMAVLGDVSAAVKRDRELRQSQSWIATLLSGTNDYALVPLDELGRVLCWNASVGRVTGLDAQASVGRSHSVFRVPEAADLAGAPGRLDEARREGWVLEDGWFQRLDGTRYWGSSLLVPLSVPGEANLCAPAFNLIIRDISERREAHEALRRSLSCDFLTGLANRRAFFEGADNEMKRWSRSQQPLSMVMIDADRFKSVNDRHGHPAGDAVLRHLAGCLTASFRARDMIARIGGEEFGILLPGTTLEGARLVAERLCAMVGAQAVEVDGVTIRYTVSGGVATMEPGMAGTDDLLKRADIALFRAKAAGRNRIECWQADAAEPCAAT